MTAPIPAYPLAWPDGWKRTPPHLRARGKFRRTERQYSSQPGGGSWLRKSDMTISTATDRVLAELHRFGVLQGDAIISTNLVLRLDGLPRGGQPEPADPGVAVYWIRPQEPMHCMAIDSYDRVADNLAAIAATLDAMCAIERHGGAQILDRAFKGFTALPAPGSTVARSWREVLGFGPTDTTDEAGINARYKRLASVHHPDKGGDTAAFQELGAARAQALAAAGLTK